eukprot:3569551-Prymnesium_polylepis.1
MCEAGDTQPRLTVQRPAGPATHCGEPARAESNVVRSTAHALSRYLACERGGSRAPMGASEGGRASPPYPWDVASGLHAIVHGGEQVVDPCGQPSHIRQLHERVRLLDDLRPRSGLDAQSISNECDLVDQVQLHRRGLGRRRRRLRLLLL